MRTPQEARFAEKWSEEPVVCGAMTSALATGAWPMERLRCTHRACQRPFPFPSPRCATCTAFRLRSRQTACRAAKLPDCAISGQRLTENSPLLRAWLLDCGYGGMLWGDETLRSDRIGLEKAAIRILKWMLQAKKL